MSKVRAIGRRIRQARRRSGLSLVDVAELAAKLGGINVDLDGLRAIEQGRADLPDSKVLKALGRALNIDPDELTAGTQYVSAASQTLLRVIDELALRPLEPQTLAELAERLAEPRDRVYRALVNLDAAGWAEQTPGGAWRMAPQVTQISERLRLALGDVHRRYLGAS